MSFYDVIGVDRGASQAEIKSAYRRAARANHPDTNPGDEEAAKRFRAANEAIEVLGDEKARARYDRTGSASPTTVRTAKHVYEVGELFARGDLADLLEATDEEGTRVLLKGVRDPAVGDFLFNEAATLTALTKTAAPQYQMYLPDLLESFTARQLDRRARRKVNVIRRLDGWHNLESVRAKTKLRFEHGVWMFNRMLEVLGHIHGLRVLHGALIPEHVMVYASTATDSEWDHGLKLIDWCYSTEPGLKISAIVPSRRAFYPPEVFAKRPASNATDIFMAAKCIIHVLGGNVETDSMPNTVPSYLQNFLRGCTLGNPASRPSDAHALRREFADFMRANFGPKKYVRFTLPQPN